MTSEEAIALLEDMMNVNRTMERGWGNSMIETDGGKIVNGELYANQHKDVADALELAIAALRAGGMGMNIPTMSAGQPLTLEQLRGKLESQDACCYDQDSGETAEVFLKKLLQSIDELKRELEIAVQDLETIMLQGGKNTDTCAYCRNDKCYVRGGRDCCNPIWRGRDKIEVAGNL